SGATPRNCGFAGLQKGADSATYGDTVQLRKQDTWTTTASTPFTLPNKGTPPTNTSADYITIRSSAYASLPSGRVGISDASNMAKVVAYDAFGAIAIANNAQYWKLYGLEITNISDGTGSRHVQDLLTSVNPGWSATNRQKHFTVDHCYV